jgi:dipeptidyl aminopeptidase/acylaminoacyl peptidase
MNVCNNGYIIIAPNYPMSSGFGKSYYNLNFSDALTDINNWKEFISQRYADIPLYYLSSSSGNILMEQSLNQDHKGIYASASLFGVPVNEYPNLPVPVLYILGENDPLIDFNTRHKNLEIAQKLNSDISVISYKGEGHWFRNSGNTRDAVDKLVRYFCDTGKTNMTINQQGKR